MSPTFSTPKPGEKHSDCSAVDSTAGRPRFTFFSRCNGRRVRKFQGGCCLLCRLGYLGSHRIPYVSVWEANSNERLDQTLDAWISLRRSSLARIVQGLCRPLDPKSTQSLLRIIPPPHPTPLPHLNHLLLTIPSPPPSPPPAPLHHHYTQPPSTTSTPPSSTSSACSFSPGVWRCLEALRHS